MKGNAKIGVEIERKYIIKMPDVSILEAQAGYTASSILQIYLPCADGETHRIRQRVSAGKATYTETKKIRIDKMSSTEIESEITEREFSLLSKNILENTLPITKTRYTFIYKEQLFEIDVYPEWQHTAIMETELDKREKSVEFPPFIEILRDVTGNKSYSNRGMSHTFPKEQL